VVSAFTLVSCVALGVPEKKSRAKFFATNAMVAKAVIDILKVKQRKLTKLVKSTGPPLKNTRSLSAPAKAPKAKKDSTNNVSRILPENKPKAT